MPEETTSRGRIAVIAQGVLVFDDPATTGLQVGGRTLLQRGVRTLAKVGIDRMLVVLPQGQATDIQSQFKDLNLQLECVNWGSEALPFFELDEPFLLLAGDHVHHHSSLGALVGTSLDGADLVAQTSDAAPDGRRWLTADDAAFVPTAGSGSRASSGAFLCAAGLFAPAALTAHTADFWSFLNDHIKGRIVHGTDIDASLWLPVANRQSARAAKHMLFDQVSKATSGTVARLLNVKISVPISRFIIDSGISPNMVTFFMVLCPGLFGAYLITRPDDYARIVVAGLLWQLASILDGCDGEIARVKLAETKFGAWFDTVTDNLAYVVGYTCMIFGMLWLHPETGLPLYLGISSIVSLVMTIGLLYGYALKTGTGSLQHYLFDLSSKVPEAEKDWTYRLPERFGFITKRDFLSLYIALGMVANQFEFVYWSLVALTHLSALGTLTTHYRLMGGQSAAAACEPQLELAINREEVA